jgi:NIMA (never in mitosis gene a)-related kinase
MLTHASPVPFLPSRYRVRRLSDNKIYALKETNVRNLSQQERQDAVNEIRLLASVQQNTAISGFHEAFIDGNRLCIVMEYAPFGDLSRALRKRQAQRKLLPEDLIWSYFIQIARGLQALHSQKILHRDVKTANVLRMSGEIVKLGDLGVAKLMKNNMTNTQIGTPHYMPPEVWRNRPYTFNSDVWALGCVLFEMCTFTVPFEARSMEELRFKVMKGKIPALPQVYSGDMQKMVKWLMILEPSQRPNIDAVLDHPSVRRRAHLAPEPEPAVPQPTNAVGGEASDAVTLGTIKVPKNLRMLKKRLPAPNYPDQAPPAAPAPAPVAAAPAPIARPASHAAPAPKPQEEDAVSSRSSGSSGSGGSGSNERPAVAHNDRGGYNYGRPVGAARPAVGEYARGVKVPVSKQHDVADRKPAASRPFAAAGPRGIRPEMEARERLERGVKDLQSVREDAAARVERAKAVLARAGLVPAGIKGPGEKENVDRPAALKNMRVNGAGVDAGDKVGVAGRRVGLSNREEGANRRVGLPPSQMGQGYGGVYAQRPQRRPAPSRNFYF